MYQSGNARLRYIQCLCCRRDCAKTHDGIKGFELAKIKHIFSLPENYTFS